MRVAEVEPLLDYLGGCEFIAIKTNWPAARSDPKERATSVIENFYTLRDAMQREPLRQANKVNA
jgi:hypothetical protein